MVKHKLIAIALCIVPVCITSCYLIEHKTLMSTANMFIYRLMQNMGPDGSFPYNPKGQEYCLYDMMIRIGGTTVDEEEMHNPTKRWKMPFDYDHANKRVTNSVMRYINIPNIYFESNPENAIVILEIVDKKENTAYVYTSDLKILEIKNVIRGRRDIWPSFLGIKVSSIHDRYSVTLIRDIIEISRQLLGDETVEEMFHLDAGTLSPMGGADNGGIQNR